MIARITLALCVIFFPVYSAEEPNRELIIANRTATTSEEKHNNKDYNQSALIDQLDNEDENRCNFFFLLEQAMTDSTCLIL